MGGDGPSPSRTLVRRWRYSGTYHRSVGERLAAALEFPRPSRATLPIGAVALASIVVATLVIAALEAWTAIPDASAVYLVAVVIAGSIGGTWPALATAIGSFVVYDILFTEPRFSLVVADPVELLNLVLVLIVALAIGRLAALGREHATEADRRATEATASFADQPADRDRRVDRVDPARDRRAADP